MRLTINHDKAIIANHIQAFFNILSHALYCLLSQPEVIILNPAYKHSIKAANDNIHSTRFVATLIVCIRLSSCLSFVQGTQTQSTHTLHQNFRSNQCVVPGITDREIIILHNTKTNFVILLII